MTKKKSVSTVETYTVDANELSVFLKKVSSYLDEDSNAIASVEFSDFEILEDGAEVNVEIDFMENEEAKLDFDRWFDQEEWEDFEEIPVETEY